MSKTRLVITAVTVEKRPVSEVARIYWVARSWVYALLARYRDDGDAAFEPRSRRPPALPRAIAEATADLIVTVRKDLAGEGLDVGLHTIAWHLAHHHQIQFGRPIGGFQALKHRMEDAYVRIEAARSAPVAGLVSALDGDAGLPLDAVVAKTVCSEALQYAAGEMIQLHGGIGITWEHDAHLYFKRAHGSAQIFGQPAEFTDAIAGLAGLR